MTDETLRGARNFCEGTQSKAAMRLGVTQAYPSLAERGTHPVSDELATSALMVYMLPVTETFPCCSWNATNKEITTTFASWLTPFR